VRALWSISRRAVFVCCTVALVAPASALAFQLSKWEAGTCKVSSCSDSGSHEDFYTQAAGHPDFGITDFAFTYKEGGLLKAKEPEGNVQDVRVDLPSGLAVNPEATHEKCTEAQLDAYKCPAESQVGVDEATGTAELLLGQKSTVEESFKVYNMVRKPGEPARFGVEINSPTLEAAETATGHKLRGELYLEGGISWYHEPETSENKEVASGDFHEYFKIDEIPTQPEVVESRLVFWGVPQEHSGVGTPTSFITLPTTCTSKPITHLHVSSHADPTHFIESSNETPVAATGCNDLPFNPSLSLTPAPATPDEPDGASVDLHIPQATNEPSKTGSPDLLSTEVTLPEGMTLNASAAHGLEACTNAQIGIGTDAQITCPEASKVAEVSIDAPGIPNGSLDGFLYLAAPKPGKKAESGEEYRVFLGAQTDEFGVGLRLEGQVKANAQTGRLTAVFSGAPAVPFEDFKIHFKGGPRATLANPLSCGAATPSASITPYTGQPPKAVSAHGFTVETGGGACAAPGFSLVQTLPAPSSTQAGAYSVFNFDLNRADGQQYASKIQTTLPPGLIGAIPSVPLCAEAQAQAGSCAATSKIGTVTVAAGAGSEPYDFTGSAYLTGPYQGAPYGLSIVVPAVAGPYNLGNVITRAGLTVGLYSGRVTVTASLPTIVEGIPLRLKSLSVTVNRPNFLFNPTSCNKMAVETLLTSTGGTGDSLSSPFQVGGCSGLAFKPSFGITTGAKISKRNGASLEVKLTQPAHEANIRQIELTLPKILPSRDSTLQKACPAASFEVATPPGSCAVLARVGSVTVNTPVLAGPLRGPAYLVSHGGAAFPDLDLVLQGDGVEVVLIGHTHISKTGYTSSNFENLPDVPISSVAVKLPIGTDSLLAANGKLCPANLIAPTLIVAQSGARITHNTQLAVSGCPLTIMSHRVRAKRVTVTVRVPAKGTLRVSGPDVRVLTHKTKAGGIVTLSVPLNGSGIAAAHGHGKFRGKLRIGFKPAAHGKHASGASLALRVHR
jgi:hypothetical protein